MLTLVPRPRRQGAEWFGGEITVSRSERAWGTLTAVDLATGKVRWRLRDANTKNCHGWTPATGRRA